ncbi:MAG: alpha/beta family hydrolase [Candidatus Krumholzibacteriia bacterium]
MPARSRNRALEGDLQVHNGAVHWIRNGAARGRPIFIVGHGAGAPYTSAFMEAVASGLVQRGITVVRFHFPYMQRAVRDKRRHPPDRTPVLLSACRAMVELATVWLPSGSASDHRLVVGGKSMGGRMMSMLLAGADPSPVAGAVYLGYPLHPAGRTHALRTEHLPAVRVPQLFLSGSKDPLARIDLLRREVDRLQHASLHVVERADHSLATSRRDPLAGSDGWLDVAAGFIHDVTRL